MGPGLPGAELSQQRLLGQLGQHRQHGRRKRGDRGDADRDAGWYGGRRRRPGLAGGGSSTHTVDAQQALRIVSPSGSVADFTGMRVSSTAPVAVMTGSPAMSLPGPGMNYYKDYLEEQVPPRTAWGKDYAVVKFRPRSDEPDLYRFIADKDGTVLTFTGDHQGEVTLDEGQFHELLTAASFRVEGTEAFMVAHYMLSQDQSHGPKDDAEYPGAFISKTRTSPRGTPPSSATPPSPSSRRPPSTAAATPS
ncbi:IgGFc-binding protein [Nannocystis pusilla]|uniref:IgGFc-binding protein n=1 Tax=Nannocystis pusilla TaxID=889268 RepID=UPI003B7CD0F5